MQTQKNAKKLLGGLGNMFKELSDEESSRVCGGADQGLAYLSADIDIDIDDPVNLGRPLVPWLNRP